MIGGSLMMVPAAFVGSAMLSKYVTDRGRDTLAGEPPSVEELQLLTETRDLKKELTAWENKKKNRESKKQKEQLSSGAYHRKIF
jgi:hypothetical protein